MGDFYKSIMYQIDVDCRNLAARMPKTSVAYLIRDSIREPIYMYVKNPIDSEWGDSVIEDAVEDKLKCRWVIL